MRMLDDLARLNQVKQQDFADPEILTRIAQYELAYRMQSSVPIPWAYMTSTRRSYTAWDSTTND